MTGISEKPAGHYPRAARCWFQHHWTKWETYVWEGRITYCGSHYTATPEPIMAKETRQKRTCLRCGLEQDRLVKEG